MIRKFILFAAFATLALSCKQKSENSESASKPDYDKILSNISYNVGSGYTKDGVRDSIFEEMVRNYKLHAGRNVRDSKKQNTRSVWFSLDMLDSLVTHLKLEREALQHGDSAKTDSVTDGVRLYFARYKNHGNSDMKERNTLIFVSTYSVGKARGHKDYLNNVPLFTEPVNNGELSPPNTFGVSWDSGVD